MERAGHFLNSKTIYYLIAFGVALTACCVLFFGRVGNRPANMFTDPQSGIIVIDAGHGGIDGGACRDGILEKDINLSIAMKLKAVLEDRGYTVVMTREEDISLDTLDRSSQNRHRRDLAARTAIINGSNAELFVSIHVNYYSRRPSADGSIVFYGDYFPQNKIMALCIQRALNGIVVNEEKRTVHDPREGDYYLLNHSQVPGVIVETAFLTNAAERKLLCEDAFHDRLARAIALGIEQYFSQIRLVGKSDW